MPIGLPVAITLLAQTASTATPPVPAPTAVAPPAKSSDDGCKDKANPDTREIVICAQKPQGYRLNPDVMLAKRAIRSGGRPTRPGPGGYHDNSRCVVGPEGCPSYGINLIGAALTAGEMASRLAKGQEIGSMFVTDPHPSEYQLYQEFKREREAKEAEKKAKAAAKAKADSAATQANPLTGK
ncbi:MAG TPA: hypothetical protein VKC17_07075 [Sphingomicrobium sp.]|nr:hypothetical protein [Sphingomicrobium sp.]